MDISDGVSNDKIFAWTFLFGKFSGTLLSIDEFCLLGVELSKNTGS